MTPTVDATRSSVIPIADNTIRKVIPTTDTRSNVIPLADNIKSNVTPATCY